MARIAQNTPEEKQGEGGSAQFSSWTSPMDPWTMDPWTSPRQGGVLRVLVESGGEGLVGIRPGVLEEASGEMAWSHLGEIMMG